MWIIDTGATHHVTGIASWLLDSQAFDCPVGLPNGATVLSTMVGSVCLSSTITLKNVLYVPNLSCNLLSVSQLCYDLQCVVQFTNNTLQHVAVSSSSLLDLWHQRLGHPSEKIVKLIPPL